MFYHEHKYLIRPKWYEVLSAIPLTAVQLVKSCDQVLTRARRALVLVTGRTVMYRQKHDLSFALTNFGRKAKTMFHSLPVQIPEHAPINSESSNQSNEKQRSSFTFDLRDFPPLSLFEHTEIFPAIRIPVTRTAELRRTLSHVVLRRRNTRNVFPVLDGTNIINKNGVEVKLSESTNSLERILVLDHRLASQDLHQNNNVHDKKRRRLTAKTISERQPTASDSSIESMTLNDVWFDPIVQQVCNDDERIQKIEYRLSWKYDDLTIEQVLRKLLPFKEIPSAFETVGHIVHVNLRDDLLPYRFWIGFVILSKLQKQGVRIKTVVHKTSQISTQYRTFPMEVIAGENGPTWSHVVVREEKSFLAMDYQNVYWNSRLAGEHKRMVEYLKIDHQQRQKQFRCTGDTVVVDLMAGIGPFAVPLTRNSLDSEQRDDAKGSLDSTHLSSGVIRMHANDLNPCSYKYLCENVKRNGCRHITCYNLDARQLVRRLQDDRIHVHHFLLNLPASAPEFLDAFRGYRIFAEDESSPHCRSFPYPMLHVYCFVPKVKKRTNEKSIEEVDNSGDRKHPYLEALSRCSKALGCSLSYGSVKWHLVRDVSPRKNMICMSFRLAECTIT
jgi:tRNA (guanine37-N1)-methyltransferase